MVIAPVLDNHLSAPNVGQMLKLPDFDDCILGVIHRNSEMFFVYSRDQVIDQLMKDMSYEDAVDHFEFNIAGSWMGKGTPAFLVEDFDTD